MSGERRSDFLNANTQALGEHLVKSMLAERRRFVAAFTERQFSTSEDEPTVSSHVYDRIMSHLTDEASTTGIGKDALGSVIIGAHLPWSIMSMNEADSIEGDQAGSAIQTHFALATLGSTAIFAPNFNISEQAETLLVANNYLWPSAKLNVVLQMFSQQLGAYEPSTMFLEERLAALTISYPCLRHDDVLGPTAGIYSGPSCRSLILWPRAKREAGIADTSDPEVMERTVGPDESGITAVLDAVAPGRDIRMFR